jgi:hypothetical protein
MKSIRPAHALAIGYLIYILLGTVLLILPISQVNPTSWLDNHIEHIIHCDDSQQGINPVGNWQGKMIVIVI